MKNSLGMLVVFVCAGTVSVNAQLSPQDAIKGMTRGINVGNTMEPPAEGTWGNPPFQRRAFDDYKNAGFTAIRIPITWDGHTATTPPYAIASTWLNRVEQVVDWGLERGLIIIIDAHHEGFVKNSYTDSSVARFDSIWSQIATRFKDKSDNLIFEMINEPYPMSSVHVNQLNAGVLQIIRRTNPTRIVSFSGYMWSNAPELVAAAIPDTADKYLIGYYHSYDPYPFGLLGPGTYGSAADINATKSRFDQATTWSTKYKIPVLLDEFGYQKLCDYNSRMCAYATVVDQALRHGVAPFAWDDGGDFPIYNRTTYGFNEIKDILIHTYPESPNGMKISQIAGRSVRIQWHNRHAGNDSITVQRKINAGTFTPYAQIAPTDSTFIDSTTTAGTAYYYRLSVNVNDSLELQSYPIMMTVSATSVASEYSPAPFELFNNYPNPFNPETVISGQWTGDSNVKLVVYDMLGRSVATLADGKYPAGRYSFRFDGSRLASGVYYYRLTAGRFTVTRSMILIR